VSSVLPLRLSSLASAVTRVQAQDEAAGKDKNRGEAEKSACNSAANPDFSTPFAALTTVEMTSFLRSKTKAESRI